MRAGMEQNRTVRWHMNYCIITLSPGMRGGRDEDRGRPGGEPVILIELEYSLGGLIISKRVADKDSRIGRRPVI